MKNIIDLECYYLEVIKTLKEQNRILIESDDLELLKLNEDTIKMLFRQCNKLDSMRGVKNLKS